MSLLTDAKTYYKYLESITSKNNAASQKTADKMMAFQREMSDTAHQREVADLKAAGLNPVLSAGGQGASSPSGAMAQTDMSAASALTGYLQSLINQQTSLGAAMIQANAARDVANIQANSPNSWAGIVRLIGQELGIFPRDGEDSARQRELAETAAEAAAKMTGQKSLSKPSDFADWLQTQRINNPGIYNAIAKFIGTGDNTWLGRLYSGLKRVGMAVDNFSMSTFGFVNQNR